MISERIRAIRGDFPWIPDDYARMLAKIDGGQRRYGLEWFDGPRRPASVLGQSASQRFPSAFWIGRRHGQLVGYEIFENERPTLYEWGSSQRQVIRRYAGIGELILSQRNNAADMRPVVRYELSVQGMAFGPWRNAGAELVADCLLSPGLETIGLANLLGRLDTGWELALVRGDNDSWLSVRKREGEFELLDSRHGSVGKWRAATRESAFSELVVLAPYNDGAAEYYFGNMTVPKPISSSGYLPVAVCLVGEWTLLNQ